MSAQGKGVSSAASVISTRAIFWSILLATLLSTSLSFGQTSATTGPAPAGQDSTPPITTGSRPGGAGGDLIVGGVADDGTLRLGVNKSQIVTLARRPGSINI